MGADDVEARGDAEALIRGLELEQQEEGAASGDELLLRRRATPQHLLWRASAARAAGTLALALALAGLCAVALRWVGPSPPRSAASRAAPSPEAAPQQLDLMKSVFGDQAAAPSPPHVLTFTTTSTALLLATAALPQPPKGPPAAVSPSGFHVLTFTTTTTRAPVTLAPLTITTTSTTSTTTKPGPTVTATTTTTTTTTRTGTTTTASTTHSSTFHECAPGAQKPTPPAFFCTVPRANYSTDTFVQEQCASRPRWEELAKKPHTSGEDCQIDPVTHKMNCQHKQTCRGTEHVEHHFTHVWRELTYDCGGQCDGAVFVNCCKTCSRTAEDPSQLGVDQVICKGCEEEALEKVAAEVDCQMVNGNFQCHTEEQCQIEDPPETCVASRHRCDIYQCNECDNVQLKASCCTQCLDLLCTEVGGPEQRILCEGCGGDEEREEGKKPGWWPFR